MNESEHPVVFPCADEWLVGMLHRPQTPASRGVLVVVGGPQYRAGSHRQFLLLARELCSRGIAVMRFDYRGMGDSSGEPTDFMSTGPDIRAAIDVFFEHEPALDSVVLWGLCDAASGILGFANTDKRVSALVLLNPWVRSEAGLAKTTLREYYGGRVLDPQWWRSLVTGKVNIAAAVRSLLATVGTLFRSSTEEAGADASVQAPSRSAQGRDSFIERMREGLAAFTGPVLLILSGDDLTAGEFRDLARTRRWRRLLARANVSRRDLPAANHTFARAEWRAQVAEWTWSWLRAW